jgi:outer membrane protein TolC
MRPGRLVLSVVVAWSSTPGSAGAQRVTPDTIPLSLPDAIRRATTESEEIRLTDAQLRTAETAVTSARSRLFPQIGADLAYVRTLENPYSPGSRAFQLPVSQRFQPDTTAPLEQRVRYLEQHAPEAGLQAIIDVFQRLPLGRDHVYSVNVNASQVLFAGGGVRAGIRRARREREAAEFAVTERRADLELEVTRAYYQSLLAQELLAIAVAALEQADRFLADQRLRLRCRSSACASRCCSRTTP